MAEANTIEQPAQADSTQERTLEDRIADQFAGPEGEEPEQVEGQESAATDAPEESEPAAPALEEVEWEGEKFNLPPKIKSALMAQADYTRKTQELADQRRMVDAQVMAMQQEGQFQQSVANELTQIQQLDWQINAYRQLDWSAMDTETITRTRVALDQLKERRGDLANALQGKRNQFEAQMQDFMRQAREKGQEYLKRAIPGWGTDVGKELSSYAVAEGYSDVEVNSLTDARMIRTLWKAAQWDKLQSQKGATTKRAETAPPVIKPGASLNKTAQGLKDANYRKALKAAPTSSAKARVVQARLEEKLFGS